MKTSVKARAVAMGAMFLFHAMLSQQAVRAAFVDEGDGIYRFTTDAPNPLPAAASLVANIIRFDAGAGLSASGGGYGLQANMTAVNPRIIMNAGSSIALDSNIGAALAWDGGGQLDINGTISATDAWGISLNSNHQFSIYSAGIINGTEGVVLDSSASMNLINYSTGQIIGTDKGLVGYSGTMTVTNVGTIQGTGAGAEGIYVTSASLDLTNDGEISGDGMGVYVQNASNVEILSSGEILGQQGPAIRLGNGGNIKNAGSGRIETDSGEAIFLDEGGSVINDDTLSIIRGQTTGIRAYDDEADVTNRGSIIGLTNAGVLFESGGTVRNEIPGLIQGRNVGVSIDSLNHLAEIHNYGNISADNGPDEGMGISISNGAADIYNYDSGSITGSHTGIQVSGMSYSGNLDNRGDITGGNTGYGVTMQMSGIVRNKAGATITAGTGVRMGGGALVNDETASIESSATAGKAVVMGYAGDVGNSGQILAELEGGVSLRHSGGTGQTMVYNAQSGLIRAHSTAIDVTSDIGTISNSGDIVSTHGVGIMTFGVVNLANDAYGVIDSYAQGILVQNGGAAAFVQNAGLIESTHSNGVDIRQSGSTFINGSSVIGALNDSEVAAVRTIGAVYVYNTNGSTLYGGNGVYSSGDQLTLLNDGLVHGQNYHAIQSLAGADVTNSSTGVIRSSSGIWGAIVNIGAPLTISNSGLIEGVTMAIYHGGPGEANITNHGTITSQTNSVIVTSGGSLTNEATGTIEGHSANNAIRGFNSVVNRGSIITPGDSWVAIETPASNSNTVRLYTGSTVIGGVVDIGGTNDEFILDGDGTGVFDQIVSGFETMHKSGTGTWTVSNDQSGISGGLQVHDGTLIVNGTMHIVDGDVYEGATLKGNGTIDGISNGTLFIRSGATLAPGNSIGGLTITDHSLQLQAGSILEIEVEHNASDWIDVEGEVHLAGTLSVKDISGGTIVTGEQYNFLSAGNGFFGEFSEIIDDSDVLNFTVAANGEFLMLTAVQEATFTDLARTPNELAIAGVLDAAMAGNELDDIIDELVGMNQQQISRAFDRLSTRSNGSASQAAALVIQRLGQDTTQVARNVRMGLGASASNQRGSWMVPGGTLLASAVNDPQVMAAAMAAAQTDPATESVNNDKRWSMYISPFGQFGDMESSASRIGYDFAAGGIFGGIDYQINDNHVVGWSLAYAYTDVTLDAGAGDSKIHSLRVGPYLNYTRDAWTFDAALTGGVHWFDQSRNVIVGGFNQTPVNDHMGYDISVHATLGYAIDLEPWTLTPTFTLQYVHMMEDGYSETGGGAANLTVADDSFNALRSILGLRVARTFDWMNIKLTPELWGGWACDLLDEQRNITSGFTAGSGPSFSTRVDNADRHSAIAGAGVAALLREDVTFHLRYEAELAHSNQSHTFWAGVELRF